MPKCNLVVENGNLFLRNEGGAYGVGLPVESLPEALWPKFKKDGRYRLTSYAKVRKGLVNFQVESNMNWTYKAAYVDAKSSICDEFLGALLGKRAATLVSNGVETAHVRIEKLRDRRPKE